MKVYDVWRIIDYKPGCVDYLGSVEAESEEEAEAAAQELFTLGEGEHFDITEEATAKQGSFDSPRRAPL